MPIDVKLLRNTQTLEIVKKSLEARGENADTLENVKHMDEKWRRSRKNVDEMNREIGKIQKNISQIMKSHGTIPEYFKEELERCYELKNELSGIEYSCRLSMMTLLKEIGNIVHESYYNEIRDPTEDSDRVSENISKIEDLYNFGSNSILKKQRLIHFSLKFLSVNGFEIFQVPLFIKSKLAEIISPLHKFLMVKAKKELVYITNPAQPLILMNYKEVLSKILKLSGFGICINKNMAQQEKISLVILCPLSKAEELFEETIQLASSFYNQLSLSFKKVKRQAKKLKLSGSIQYDFILLHENYITKLFSCCNHTSYFSRDLKITEAKGKHLAIITANFCNINILARIVNDDLEL